MAAPLSVLVMVPVGVKLRVAPLDDSAVAVDAAVCEAAGPVVAVGEGSAVGTVFAPRWALSRLPPAVQYSIGYCIGLAPAIPAAMNIPVSPENEGAPAGVTNWATRAPSCFEKATMRVSVLSKA